MSNTETGVKLDVRAYPIENPKGNVIAFASVTIADVFAVHNIRIVNGEKGPFVAMPQIKANGEYRDICFPVTAALRTQLNEAVLNAYADALEKSAPAKESTVDKLRENKRTAKEKSSPAKTAKKTEPEI